MAAWKEEAQAECEGAQWRCDEGEERQRSQEHTRPR